MSEKKEIAVVVTTEFKGVFFGYGVLSDEKTVTLKNCRMCVSWPVINHGVLGLASHGPKNGARVSPRVPQMVIQNVTAMMVVTAEAVALWESEPWT